MSEVILSQEILPENYALLQKIAGNVWFLSDFVSFVTLQRVLDTTPELTQEGYEGYADITRMKVAADIAAEMAVLLREETQKAVEEWSSDVLSPAIFYNYAEKWLETGGRGYQRQEGVTLRDLIMTFDQEVSNG